MVRQQRLPKKLGQRTYAFRLLQLVKSPSQCLESGLAESQGKARQFVLCCSLSASPGRLGNNVKLNRVEQNLVSNQRQPTLGLRKDEAYCHPTSDKFVCCSESSVLQKSVCIRLPPTQECTPEVSSVFSSLRFSACFLTETKPLSQEDLL